MGFGLVPAMVFSAAMWNNLREGKLAPQDCGRNLGKSEGDGFWLRLAKILVRELTKVGENMISQYCGTDLRRGLEA